MPICLNICQYETVFHQQQTTKYILNIGRLIKTWKSFDGIILRLAVLVFVYILEHKWLQEQIEGECESLCIFFLL